MTPLSEFMPYVLPYVAGCTYPLAELHIRNICIDFCTQAPIVQEALDPVDVVTDQIEYDIDATPQTEPTLILSAAYRTRPLAIFKASDVNLGQLREMRGEPMGVMQQAGAVFELDRTPAEDAPGAISLRIATKPTRSAVAVADVLFRDYAYEIGQGVVGRLLMMPGHEFSAPANAGFYTAIYETARTAARIRAERSFGTAPMRVNPRRFG